MGILPVFMGGPLQRHFRWNAISERVCLLSLLLNLIQFYRR